MINLTNTLSFKFESLGTENSPGFGIDIGNLQRSISILQRVFLEKMDKISNPNCQFKLEIEVNYLTALHDFELMANSLKGRAKLIKSPDDRQNYIEKVVTIFVKAHQAIGQAVCSPSSLYALSRVMIAEKINFGIDVLKFIHQHRMDFINFTNELQ